MSTGHQIDGVLGALRKSWAGRLLDRSPSGRGDQTRSIDPEGIDAFIETRRPALAELTEAEVEARSSVALSKVDKERALKDAEALRGQWMQQSAQPRVHHRPE